MQTGERVAVCVCQCLFPGRLLRSWLLPGAPWGISRLPLLVDLYLHDQEILASVQLEGVVQSSSSPQQSLPNQALGKELCTFKVLAGHSNT